MTDERLVRDVGEFGLIELLERTLPARTRAGTKLALGIGDDAAIWQPEPDENVVITTDSLVEGIHFRLDWTDWESLGHKILAVNISDIAAMAAVPRLAVVTLGLTGNERVTDLEALYTGLGNLAGAHEMVIAGGDIVRSPAGTVFHVTALGTTQGKASLRRSGARVGDQIAVSGTLGAAAAGVRLLALPEGDSRRRAATADLLIAAQLRPQPRVALGAILLAHGASAAMDLSDGLLGDLPKILAASGVSARLDARLIPVAAALRALFPEDWLDLALRGGEDYELLFTVSPESMPGLAEAARSVGGVVTVIGEIVASENGESAIEITDLEGQSRRVVPGAFDHFRSSE